MIPSVPASTKINAAMIDRIIFRLDFLNITAPQFITDTTNRFDLCLCFHES